MKYRKLHIQICAHQALEAEEVARSECILVPQASYGIVQVVGEATIKLLIQPIAIALRIAASLVPQTMPRIEWHCEGSEYSKGPAMNRSSQKHRGDGYCVLAATLQQLRTILLK